MRSAINDTTQLSLPLRASEVYFVSEVILRIVKFCLRQSGKLNFTRATARTSQHGNITKFAFAAINAVLTKKRGRGVFTTLRPFLAGR